MPEFNDSAASLTRQVARIGEQGQHDEAAILAEVAESVTAAEFGTLSPEAFTAASNAASRRGEAGDFAYAARRLAELAREAGKVLGPNHLTTLRIRQNAAAFVGMTGQYAQAVEQFAVLVPQLWSLLGADHPDTRRAANNLQSWESRLGRLSEL